MKATSRDFTPNFQPSQILCLEHRDTYLYAEVIQILETRKMCWVRPLMLKTFSSENNGKNNQEISEDSTLWDLREGADLVWPICLFREAIDTEVIPLLAELELLEDRQKNRQISHQQLKNFVSIVWQAYPDVFPIIKNS
ncbi:MAG: hypothetical protein QNJ68_08475 [Microcoleaceae cyanobacterium MO_207.B10]|nr:hypothetical protein [Microcoleaceae cyanobacterium MO_207.B10]